MYAMLVNAQRILVDAHRLQLEFADELGQGKWTDRDGEAALRAVEIGAEIRKATALLMALADEVGPSDSSITMQ